jgi:hypothetical protein
MAEAIIGLAVVAGSRHEHRRATRLLAAKDAIWISIRDTPEPAGHKSIERVSEEARSSLGEDAYAVAWNEGRAMSLDQAVSYALDEEAYAVD